MDYKFKVVLLHKDKMIVLDTEANKYLLVDDIASIVASFIKENAPIEFRALSDFDFNEPREISELEYLTYKAESEVG